MSVNSAKVDKIHNYVHRQLGDTPYYIIIIDSNDNGIQLHNIKNNEDIPDMLRELANRMDEGRFYEIPNDN